MDLDTVYGGNAANSYLTVDEADAYLEMKLLAVEWSRADDMEKSKALLQAARDIERMTWVGEKYWYYQALEFPRVTPEYGNLYWRGGGYRSLENTIPVFPNYDEYLSKQKRRVQHAQAEQALYVLRTAGRRAHREDQFEGARSVSRGARYSESFGYGYPSLVLCPEAADHLSWYKGSPTIVRV